MKNFTLLLFILISVSCNKQDNFFFLRNDNADMPIVVRGNENSGIYIIFLHGGPGNGTYVWEDFFKGIEKNFSVVYWNQRAAGESQGNTNANQMTVAQFVEDLDKVVMLINNLYNKPKIFLMGHSWGGLLGTAYLIEHSDKIAGWIEVDGAHNKILGEIYAKKWVMDYANSQVNQGIDSEYWNDALNWYNTYTGPLTFSSKHYTEYLDKAHAYFYQKEIQWYSVSDFFFGRANGFDLLLNGSYSSDKLDNEVVSIDLTPDMHAITIPSLILWGRHDGTIPFEMAEDAYHALGTSPDDKSIIYFENSAHSPMIEETNSFNKAVVDFVNSYK